MDIIGIQGLDKQQILNEVQQGARFVIYQYCISIIILTFKRPSDIYFIRPGESSILKGLSFSIMSILLGWWGFPWGPIYTIGALFTNFSGGKNVTEEIAEKLQQFPSQFIQYGLKLKSARANEPRPGSPSPF